MLLSCHVMPKLATYSLLIFANLSQDNWKFSMPFLPYYGPLSHCKLFHYLYLSFVVWDMSSSSQSDHFSVLESASKMFFICLCWVIFHACLLVVDIYLEVRFLYWSCYSIFYSLQIFTFQTYFQGTQSYHWSPLASSSHSLPWLASAS